MLAAEHPECLHSQLLRSTRTASQRYLTADVRQKYRFTGIWHATPERHDSRHRALREIHAGLNSGCLPPEHDEPGSHCTPTARARFCRGPMAWFPRPERHLPQQTHRGQPRDEGRPSNPKIPSNRATEVAIPRVIGPRQRLCEQGHAPNHHAFGTFVTEAAYAPSAPKASGDR